MGAVTAAPRYHSRNNCKQTVPPGLSQRGTFLALIAATACACQPSPLRPPLDLAPARVGVRGEELAGCPGVSASGTDAPALTLEGWGTRTVGGPVAGVGRSMFPLALLLDCRAVSVMLVKALVGLTSGPSKRE